MPPFAVKRSALPLITTWQSLVGVNVPVNLWKSSACQVAPSLLGNEYWLVLTVSIGVWPVGRKRSVRLVAEYLPPIGPAPEKIASGSGRLVFQTRAAVIVAPFSSGSAVCPNAALGLNVPPLPPLSFHISGCPADVG